MRLIYIQLISLFLFIFSKNIRQIEESTKTTETYDLVVVGGGLAGLTATFKANQNSKGSLKIALIEKLADIGGNSNKATSGINLLETEPQKMNNISDNYSLFYNDTMKSGKYINNPSLVHTLTKGAQTLYDYYTNNFDIDIQKVSKLGGHTVARTHRPTDSSYVIGSYLINRISSKVKNIANVTILYNSTVTELNLNKTNNKIYGLKYIKNENDSVQYNINCKAIILTTGGYGHDFGDNGLLKEYASEYMNYPTTNGAQSTGSGIKLARSINAELVDMKEVQVHPTGFVDPKSRYAKNKFLAPELLRGVGGILINENGERFCNELGTRDYVYEKIISNCKKQDTTEIDQYESYLLLNEEMANDFGLSSFNYYKNVKGFISEYSNFEELAKNLSMNYSKLENTIIEHNKAFDNLKKDDFNKTSFTYKFDLNKKIYSMIVTPSIHYTMGGVKINNNTEVIDTNGKPIKGLFGAGEVTGGVHGGNRLGGNSLSECGTFGRVASDSAVDYIINKYNNTDDDDDDYDDDFANNNILFRNRRKKRGIGAGGIIAIILVVLAALISIIVIATVCLKNIDKTMSQNIPINDTLYSVSRKPL